MTGLRCWLAAACLVVAATPALAFTPQTIVIDGVNDFDPSNLLEDDGIDTQQFCSPSALPLDVGKVFVTNDANFLYIGIEFAQTCFCDMNLGLAIDVNTAGGGTTDPFGRAIAWNNLPKKPDFYLYDVTPTGCNSFNYEVIYKWNTGTVAWDNVSTQVNPSWGTGSNGLGIADGATFKEIKLPLSVLGLTTGVTANLEVWVTQEGITKGPLDAMCSDAVQLSSPGSTTFDVVAPVEMTCMLPYTVQNAVDVTPPTVNTANAVDFQLLLDKTFALTTNKIDVVFSEPVDETSAENTANYAFSGPVSRSVTSAVRDPQATNLVRLTLNSAIGAAASFYNITVTGVKDLASAPNTIVNNGDTNVGSLFIQNVTFNGNMALPLCNGSFAVDDTFSVEGSLTPLTFAQLCDNAFMYDDEGDSVYTVVVPFSLPKNRTLGFAKDSLEWKFVHQCSNYESGGNRKTILDSNNGASIVLDEVWNHENPSDYTSHPIDVVFQVDANSVSPAPADTFYLQGSQAPLSFTPSGIAMKDDGVDPDQAAGDGIYAARVQFPSCTAKNVGWKIFFRGNFECLDQGNRSVYLNDALFGTGGSELVLPARGIDACTVTDKPITVVFKVDMRTAEPNPAGPDTVAIGGGRAPLDFGTPWTNLMADDGAGYDDAAGDFIYTKAVTFPDSTEFNVEFKFWLAYFAASQQLGTSALDDGYECLGYANRSFMLDDVNYSTGNPLVRVLSTWNYCSDPTAVPFPGLMGGGGASFATLQQSIPNPFTPRTAIRFDLRRAGRVSLSVFDITGRRVTTLLDRDLVPGPHEVVWNGTDQAGRRVKSGVYLYELSMGGERLSRRMVYTR